MATRWAVANGNWSATSTWDGLTTLPGAGDDVYADGKTVTIDQDVTVLSIRNTNRGGGTNGGTFNIATARTVTASATGFVSLASPVLTITGTANITLNGTVVPGSTATQTVSHASSGTLTINGNISGGGGNLKGVTATSGPLVVVGNLTGGSGVNSYAVDSTGTSANVTVTGTVTGGSGGAALNCTGTSAVVTITGNVAAVSGAGGNIPAVSLSGNSLTKWHSIIGNVTATNSTGALGNHGVTDSNTGGGGVAHGGSLTDSTQGDCALNVRRYRCISTAATTRVYTNNSGYPTGGTITYGSQDYIPSNVPLPADVRFGISYGSGTFTGTCRVPAASSVAAGVLVDATTGTAALSPSDVAALVGAQIAAAMTTVP